MRRTVYPEVSVRIEYDLTTDGDRLRPVVEVMREFGLRLKARDAHCEVEAETALPR